jgi:hypothetical protein
LRRIGRADSLVASDRRQPWKLVPIRMYWFTPRFGNVKRLAGRDSCFEVLAFGWRSAPSAALNARLSDRLQPLLVPCYTAAEYCQELIVKWMITRRSVISEETCNVNLKLSVSLGPILGKYNRRMMLTHPRGSNAFCEIPNAIMSHSTRAPGDHLSVLSRINHFHVDSIS